MSAPLDARIRDLYDQLTASERLLADVTLELQSHLAAYTASELAERAGVSKATAARFFRRLGYSSFNAMRVEARERAHWGSPLYELANIDSPTSEPDLLAAHMAHDLRNLSQTFEALEPAQVERAVELLAAARRIWVIGFRNSHGLAEYARSLLLHLKPSVELLPGPALTLAETVASVQRHDLLLVFDFRRRLALLEAVVEQGRAAGARVVLITDPSASPLIAVADVALRCHCQGADLFDSYAAPMSLMSHLGSALAHRLDDQARTRLERIEVLHQRLRDLSR